MNILIVPDSFKGSLSSKEVCKSIKDGIESTGNHNVECLPFADGGGFVLHSVVADGLDVCPGGGLCQKGVVALGENLRKFHGNTLLKIIDN